MKLTIFSVIFILFIEAIICLGLFIPFAHAENSCPATLKVMRESFKETRSNIYCVPFVVFFPWGTCSTRLCWNGAQNAYPLSAGGYACNTYITCRRVGRSKKYSCRY